MSLYYSFKQFDQYFYKSWRRKFTVDVKHVTVTIANVCDFNLTYSLGLLDLFYVCIFVHNMYIFKCFFEDHMWD